ncbi:MAG: site-specific integrase [Bacteroidota bacterium]
MASIYQKGGILYLSWYDEDISGERIRRRESLKLKDTRENRKIANLIKKQKEHTLLFSLHELKKEITVNDAYDEFIETKKKLAEKTKEYYEQSIRSLKEKYGNAKVDKITNKEINNVIEGMEHLGEESKNTYKKGMKTFFNYLMREKYYFKKNPVEEVRSTGAKRIETITDKELEKLLGYFKKRNMEHYDLVKLLVLSGFRISEAIALHWEDIKSDHIIVRNKKGKRNDFFPITAELRKHLSTIEKKGKKVFRYKEVSSVRYLNSLISKKTNNKYSFHSLRKKFATEWAKHLMPAELKELMRHRDIRTTMKHYVGLNIIKIGEKMTVTKWGLKEEITDKNCQIIDIKTGEIRQKGA